MDRTAANGTTSLSRAMLAALFLGVCASMHSLAAQHSPLLSSGVPALTFNLLGLPFLCLFTASCYSLGSPFIPKLGLPSRLDRFLLATLTGYCLFTLLGVATGLLRLLSPTLAASILALPLLWFPVKSLRFSLSWREIAPLTLLGAVTLWLFCCSGLLHQYTGNDFAHYYSMSRIELARGDLLPNVFFLAYFYLKGFGAVFLMQAATSEYTAPLATFFALNMMALLTYRMTAMLTANPFVAIATPLLLLASKIMRLDAYKAHSTISMLLLACPYYMARLEFGPATLRPRLALLLALLLCTTVVALPPASIFLTGPLLLLLGSALWRPNALRLGRAVAIAAAPTLTFAFMLIQNYALTGIPEVTPIGLFERFINFTKTSEWIPTAELRFQLAFNRPSGRYSFSPSGLGSILAPIAIGLALAAFLHWRLRVRYPFLLRRLWIVLAPVLALGAACPLLELVTHQDSIKRLIVFYPAIQAQLAIGVLLAALTVILDLVAAKHGPMRRRGMSRPLVSMFFALVGLYGLVFNWTPNAPHRRMATRAFFGITSEAPLFGHWREEGHIAEQLDAELPKNVPVLPLQFTPYASMVNSERFLRPLESERLRELPILLGPDPAAARAAYLRVGIRHFLVNLSPLSPSPFYANLIYEGYSSLFSPNSIAAHFRVKPLPGDNWLLILDGTDAEGPPPDKHFLTRYAQFRDKSLSDPTWGEPLELARHEIPELALPNLELPETDAPK